MIRRCFSGALKGGRQGVVTWTSNNEGDLVTIGKNDGGKVLYECLKLGKTFQFSDHATRKVIAEGDDLKVVLDTLPNP